MWKGLNIKLITRRKKYKCPFMILTQDGCLRRQRVKKTFYDEYIFVSTSSDNKFRKDSVLLKVENLAFDSSMNLK